MNTHNIQRRFQNNIAVVSNYFKELRFSENLTQEQVGIEAGLHRNTILNIENSKNYEILTLFQLCDFYDITPSELLSILDD